MSLNALVAPLARVPLFAGLEPRQLMAMVRAAERVVFQPGDAIIAHGKDGSAAFLIMHGEAVWVRPEATDCNGPALEIHTLVGEMAMLTETEYGATVIARTVVHALKLSRATMFDLIEQDPDIAGHFAARMSGRLHAVADELRALDRLLADQSARLSTLIEARHPAPQTSMAN